MTNMTNINFEIFLGNISFVILFLIMILYWVEAIFSMTPKFNLIIFLTTSCANVALFALLIIRWLNYGHFPLSNLYESLLFLSWSFTLIQLFFLASLFHFNLNTVNFNILKFTGDKSPISFNPFFSNVPFNISNAQTVCGQVKKAELSLPFAKYKLRNKFLLCENFYKPVNKSKAFFTRCFVSEAENLNKVQASCEVFTEQKHNGGKQRDNQRKNIDISLIIGTILSPIALFTNSFATFSLPKNMQKAQALVPALQSNWLMMHVTVMMLSYTALLCGSLLAITFLVITWHDSKKNKKVPFLSHPFYNINTETIPALVKKNKNEVIKNTASETVNFNGSENLAKHPKLSFLEPPKLNLLTTTNNQNEKRIVLTEHSSELLHDPFKTDNYPTELVHDSFKTGNDQDFAINKLAKTLDNLSYRILGIGFPLLTIGILSGAVWANEAWGSYWSWDPKETWAFITWLIFAIYLHARITKGWEGKKPAILASFGFFIVWICYLGVNILGTGLHSYGWIQFKT